MKTVTAEPSTKTPGSGYKEFKDLKSLLSEKPEMKTPPASVNIPATPVNTPEEKPVTTENAASTETVVPPAPEPAKVNTADFAEKPIVVEPSKPAAPVKPTIPFADQATQIVMFVDGLQTLCLPWLYQKGIFTKAEYKRLVELKAKIKTAADPKKVLQPGDEKIYEKYLQYKELTADLPFTDTEVKLIRDPLAAVMEKYNWNMGPESLLVGAILTVMAPRLMPLMARLDD